MEEKIKSILSYLILLTNRLRGKLDENCFSYGFLPVQNALILDVQKFDYIVSLKGVVRPAFYMLELKARLPVIRISGTIELFGQNKPLVADKFFIPIVSERMCKRLVRINSNEIFRLSLQLPSDQLELRHIRLIRVSNKFARSRMVKKLQELHPMHKPQAPHHFRPKVNTSVRHIKTLALWTDYCQLFNETAKTSFYGKWLEEFDTHKIPISSKANNLISTFNQKPLISFILPVYNPNSAWLEQIINSVFSQSYSSWELCISDDASTDPVIRSILLKYSAEDSRVRVMFRPVNGHISVNSNCALALALGSWIALIDHDDLLAEDALLYVADVINRVPQCKLIYSDEDKIDENGDRFDAYFKPDWNEDLFHSQNMFSHLGVYDAALVREVGGFRVGFEGSQDYDLALRCTERVRPDQIYHIPRVLYHWRTHANSTAYSIDAKPYAILAGERALQEHFDRLGIAAKVKSTGYGYRVSYPLPSELPLVSLIIPTRNKLKLLKQCIDSIFLKTNYSNYEIIIIDNGSDDPATLRYIKNVASDSRVRVIRDSRPFNYSALNNAAVQVANGQLLCLLNNDVEVINADWLGEMVSHALRPGVGAVGARLWYADDTIQHAGVVLGLEGFAGHIHRYLPRGSVGYCSRAALTQSFSAVTGACLVVKKSSYLEVGGLNEIDLQVACNDIDLCLKLGEAGYRTIWTPWAELYHHESSTRGFDDTSEKVARAEKEVAYMWTRWGDKLRYDPAYNPNLTLDNSDFGLAWPPRITQLFPPSVASVLK